MTTIDRAALVRTRLRTPDAIPAAWAARRPGAMPGDGRLLIIAADHPARGALGVRDAGMAMADRVDLLSRISTALGRPGHRTHSAIVRRCRHRPRVARAVRDGRALPQ